MCDRCVVYTVFHFVSFCIYEYTCTLLVVPMVVFCMKFGVCSSPPHPRAYSCNPLSTRSSLSAIAALHYCWPMLLLPPSIAVLQGRYKLIWGYPGWNNPSWNGWIQAPTAFREGKEYDGDALLPSHPQANPPRPGHECLAAACLYDIIADPTEHTNIAAKHAPIVATMKARILELLKTEVTVEKSGLCPTPCGSTADPRCTQIAKDTGFWQPWLTGASIGAQCPPQV